MAGFGLQAHRLVAILICCLTATSASAQLKLTVPPREVQVMLIRNCLASVNHASITGNFTVLRDLGSEKFKRKYQASDLSLAFRALREQNIDLSPVLVQYPKLTQDPELSEDGRLRLIGQCATQPLAVRFDLAFQHGPRGWGIDDIGVAMASAPPELAPASFEELKKQE